MAVVEHGEPIRPPGGGISCFTNGRCDASLVERPVRGIHSVLAVEVPQEPSEGPILLGRAVRGDNWEQRTTAWSRQHRKTHRNHWWESSTQGSWWGLERWQIPVGPCLHLAWKRKVFAGRGKMLSWRRGMPQVISPGCVGALSGGSS